ncbi:MAG: helix-turn-helix domain-containing protein [Oscillospiraceae bacterium]|nr:helix-turn-helix domain-containing protein [Oscillospiraceae bacterium]
MLSRKIFGERLYEARTKHQETQAELAAALGIGKSRVSEMESGKNTTTMEKLVLLCEHYNISADYLLGLSDDPRPRAQTRHTKINQ